MASSRSGPVTTATSQAPPISSSFPQKRRRARRRARRCHVQRRARHRARTRGPAPAAPRLAPTWRRRQVARPLESSHYSPPVPCCTSTDAAMVHRRIGGRSAAATTGPAWSSAAGPRRHCRRCWSMPDATRALRSDNRSPTRSRSRRAYGG